MIRPNLHGFMKSISCLTSLISFYNKVTHLVDMGSAVDIVDVEFSKAFDTASHSILQKLVAHSLDGNTFCWVEKLVGWPGPKCCGGWS